MSHKLLCRSCQCLSITRYEPYQARNRYGSYQWFEGGISYVCKKTLKSLRRLRFKCHDYMPYTQLTLTRGDKPMVKVDLIPNEGDRWELDELPDKLDLKATSEKMVSGGEGKAGGLQIEFVDPDGKRLTQKYTPVSGAVLGTALKKLKVEDTADLSKGFYTYEKTRMRMGKDRMIPIAKCKA